MNFSTSQLFKHSAFGTAVFAALAANAIVPVLDTSSVTVTQRANRTVVIEYTMNPAASNDDGAAIVTVDILTNAVGCVAASVGGEHLTTLSGDVNKIVTHTANYKHMILWEPKSEGMPEFTLPAAQVTAQVTLWATNSPPAYWIIDLTHPADRSFDRYYPNAEQVPGTVTNELYKTDRLVFRHIPAKGVTWKMGGASTENGFNTYHYVTFSYDYWMAIYEYTNAQYNRLKPSDWAAASGTTPKGFVFNGWRGSPTGSGFNWPVDGHGVSGSMVLGGMRTKLGGIMVDLPTEAEWEFACRAGSSAKYCNGDTTADLDLVAWTKTNGGTAVHEVGTKEPNAWGLYDMHGNLAEWTLDKFSRRTSAPVWDPTGPTRENQVTWTGDTTLYMGSRGGGLRKGTTWNDDYTSFAFQALKTDDGECAARLTIPLP